MRSHHPAVFASILFLLLASAATEYLQATGAGRGFSDSEAFGHDARRLWIDSGPHGTEIRPEDFGAKGDGRADDWKAFQTMFDKLKGSPPVKILLRPKAYYSIRSRRSAANVFEIIGVDSLQMEGPGMGRKTIAYEGAQSATNFFYFSGGSDYFRLEEMTIEGSRPGDWPYKTANCINLNNCNFGSFNRLQLRFGSGYGITGFHWMTEVNHVIAFGFDTGFGTPASTAHFTGCYANSCRIGYEIAGWYASYTGCSCDWADVAYSFREPWSVALAGCGCEASLQAMSGRALQLSVQGFTVDQTGLQGSLRFANGSREPRQGETITGAASRSRAIVFRVHVTSGTWAGGDAAGTIRINEPPSGAFRAESLEIGDENNVCTIAGDIAKPEAAFYLPASGGLMSGLFGKVACDYWFDCANSSAGLVISMPGGWSGRTFKSQVKDYASAPDAQVPAILGLDYTGYSQIADRDISDLRSFLETDFSRYTACQDVSVEFNDGTAEWTSTVRWAQAGGAGRVILKAGGTTQGAILDVRPVSGPGIVLENIQIPVIFRGLTFRLHKAEALFAVSNCRLVRFENCRFESSAAGRVFRITDSGSRIEIDKATMDNMAAANWTGLADPGGMGGWEAFRFTGYTGAPAAGLFDAGHRIEFAVPAPGGHAGAVCTKAGAPGTWKGIGSVER